MVEKTGKRMPTSSSLGLISDTISSGLDFSKGFTYKNQDLDSVHSSADEIRSLNRKRMEQHLGIEISKEEPSDEYVRDYAKSLTGERAKIADNLASQGYDFNESVAYLDNYERLRFANPMGTGLEIFQKKPVSFTESETWDTIKPWAEVGGTLLGLEGVGKWLETSGKKQYEKYVRPTQMDVNRMYKDAGNVGVYDDVTKKLEEQEKLIENMKSNGASPEEIAKEQEVYDTMKESRERYNNDKRKTTVDVANEKGIAGTELEMAEQAYRKRRTEWITEVEPKMVRSNARFNPVTDVLDTLGESDFNVTRELREKEYKPYLEELKEFYANEGEMSLRDLQEWRNKIDASRKFTETGEEVKNVASNVNDHIDRKLGEIIGDTLEKEYPGQGLREKVKDYGLMKEFEKAHAKKAASQLTKAAEKEPMDIRKRVKGKAAKIYDKIFGTNDISRQTKVGQWKQKRGKRIRPSTWISGAKDMLVRLGANPSSVDKAIKVATKSEKVMGLALPKILRKMVGVMGEIARPAEAYITVDFLGKHANEYAVIPLLEEKLSWANGNPSDDTKGWTEEDWEELGLGSDDIWEIIYSDGFREIAERGAWDGDNVIMRYAPLTNRTDEPLKTYYEE